MIPAGDPEGVRVLEHKPDLMCNSQGRHGHTDCGILLVWFALFASIVISALIILGVVLELL